MADGSVKIDVGLNISKAERDLARLKDKINKAEDALNADSNRKNAIEQQLGKAGAAADAAKQKVMELKQELANTRSRDEKASIRAQLADATEEQRILTRESDRLNDEYVKVSASIEKGEQNLTEMKEEAGQLAQQISRSRPGAALAEGMEAARKGLMKFLKYAIGIRSVYFLFRRLRSAITESVKAYAEHDKELKTQLATLEATKKATQLASGAALAGIYQAILPVVQKIANWMLEAANAAAKFIAILSGKSSYKKTVVDTEAVAAGLEDTSAAADDVAESAKEAKKQLMGFDELNILDDNRDSGSSGRGGGGSGGGAGSNGVSVVEEAIDELDNSGIAKIARFIRDHMDEIKDAALGIGAALGTWKIGKLIEKITGLSIATEKLLGVALGVGGAIVYIKGFFDAWNNGLDNGNLTEMIIGATVAVVGFGLAFGTIGAGVASFISGIGLAAVGLKEWAETGEMTEKVLTALNAGIGLVGVSLALLTGSWIPMAIAAIGMLLFNLPEVLGGLSDFFYKLGFDSLGDWFKGMSEKAANAREWLRTNVVVPVCEYISSAFEEWNSGEHRGEYKDSASWFICGVLGLPTDEEWKQWGIDAISWLGQGFIDLTHVLHDIIGGPLENLIEKEIPETIKQFKDIGRDAINWLGQGFIDLTRELHNIIGGPLENFVENDIPQAIAWFKEVGPTAIRWIGEGFSSLFSDLSEFIGTPFHNFVDGLMEWWANIRLQPFHIPHPVFEWGTKEATGLVAKALQFVGLEPVLPTLSIGWYAKGGVFDMPSLIGVGENGKEAVVPLEKNTEWMQMVADGLMERFEKSNFANQLAEAFVSTPLPAMAGGSIVPPNAYSAGYGGDMSASALLEELRELRNAILNQPIRVSGDVYLDKRKVGQSVSEYQRNSDRANGVS